jgi:hypothetical protein
MDTTIYGANNLAYTAHDNLYTSTCTGDDGYTNGINYIKETDIILSKDINWEFMPYLNQSISPNMYDFYHTFLHELGHAALLNHVNDETSVMYRANSAGYTQAANRKVFINPNIILGGQDVANLSHTTTFTNCGNLSPMQLATPADCSGTSNIEENITSNNGILVYPNPSNGTFNITSKATINQIQISDVLGKIIYQEKSNNNQTTINLQNQSTGIYFISLSDGTKTQQAKIIIK